MGKRLDDAQIERFRSDGIVFPLRALSNADAAVRLRWLEEMEASRAGRIPPALNAKIHLLVPWLWELVRDSSIVDPVEDLIGPDILCLGTSFISKAARGSRYVTWHQDATHWNLSAPVAVTAWVALTPSTRTNGCVRVIPGTNKKGLPHRDNGDRANMLGRREEVLGGIDAAQAVDVVLAPGEMSLHDPLVVHGSEPNRSVARRTGFAIRYIPAHAALRDGQRSSATLVRGRDHGHFDLEVPPEGLFHPAAMQRHARIVRLLLAVIFKNDAP